jgi:hypothetical protein
VCLVLTHRTTSSYYYYYYSVVAVVAVEDCVAAMSGCQWSCAWRKTRKKILRLVQPFLLLLMVGLIGLGVVLIELAGPIVLKKIVQTTLYRWLLVSWPHCFRSVCECVCCC